jgi:hypothetical protein
MHAVVSSVERRLGRIVRRRVLAIVEHCLTALTTDTGTMGAAVSCVVQLPSCTVATRRRGIRMPTGSTCGTICGSTESGGFKGGLIPSPASCPLAEAQASETEQEEPGLPPVDRPLQAVPAFITAFEDAMVEDLSQESEFRQTAAGLICVSCGHEDGAHAVQDAELPVRRHGAPTARFARPSTTRARPA